MADDFVVKDSSIWRNRSAFSAATDIDGTVKVGFIQSFKYDKDRGETIYIVEVMTKGSRDMIPCVHARRFGGAHNYEDFILQGFNSSEKDRRSFGYANKAGDAVVIAYLDGNSRSGIILGGLNHLSRKQTIKPEEGVQYVSVFNGIENSINKDGEFTLTFKGLPTNQADLEKAPSSSAIPAPKYDESIGGSFMKFDKTGGWTLSDKAKKDPQSIKIDKEEGTLTIVSGKISIALEKSSQRVALKAKELEVTSDKVGIKSKETKIEGSQTVKISGPKIAIGGNGTELIDTICSLVDAIGTLTAISPIGPCTPLTAAPSWASVTALKAKLSAIKGSL